jgi:hypothetical protein
LAPGESTLSSTILASPTASSFGSSSEPESAPTSIYCVDCDAHHIAGPNDFIQDHDDSFTSNRSYNSSAYLARFQCAVIDPATGLDDGNPQISAGRTTVQISEKAWKGQGKL